MDPKILLIDDSAILRRIAVNVLSSRNFCGEVVTATRGTEGFARACASGVGLILVDYQIAGAPNAELCQRLLAEPRTSHVPVILLLGPGMTPPAKESLSANIVDFLVKPFTPEQLVSAVKSALSEPGSDVPVGRLREPAATSAAGRMEPANDRLEVTAAVNATTLVRHETPQVFHARVVTRPAAAPVTREVSGSRLRVEPARLRTALDTAVRQQETGAFRVQAESGPAAEIFLENGLLVVVATKDSKQYSEEAESVVPPKVSPAIFDEAVSEQSRTGVPFFLSLGSRGLLSKTVATGLLHRFGQRHFARFWTMPPESLTYEFVTMDALPGFALRLEPHRESLDGWLLGASRNLCSEDIAASARHEGFAGTPSFREEGLALASALPLSDEERAFCRQMSLRRDLAAVAKGCGITPEQAYLLLFRLRCLGIADYRLIASAFVVTPRTSVRRVLPLHR